VSRPSRANRPSRFLVSLRLSFRRSVFCTRQIARCTCTLAGFREGLSNDPSLGICCGVSQNGPCIVAVASPEVCCFLVKSFDAEVHAVLTSADVMKAMDRVSAVTLILPPAHRRAGQRCAARRPAQQRRPGEAVRGLEPAPNAHDGRDPGCTGPQHSPFIMQSYLDFLITNPFYGCKFHS
jgi:hypothetical protein